VGAILVAGATSLPEIVTGVSAVWQGETALAIGNLFGSNMANMAILASADLATRQTHLLAQVAMNQAMVAALAISLTGLAAVGLLSRDSFTLGWAPWLIAAGYVLGMRMLHRNRKRPEAAGPRSGTGGLRGPVIGFVVAAAVILITGPMLASSGATLARQWGIAAGFFGVVFLAAATSLPEVSTVLAAMRQGSHDLAVGNLLGSNCFNMVILLALDVADGAGGLLSAVDPAAGVGAMVSVVLMAQVLLDYLNRPERRVWYLDPGPGLMLATYAAGLFITYRVTH
jgi:cation:H+ antiporter